MFKGLIFDLDGTIADTLPLCIEAFRRSIEPLARRHLSDAEIISTFGPSEEGTIMALAPAYYDQGIASYLEYYEQLHAMCPSPFPGITELLHELRNKQLPLAMVTGKGRYSTAISLKAFDLLNLFDPIETGAPHGPRKAEGIQSVLDEWKITDKRSVLYLGDAPGDIRAARVAGIPVAAVTWATTTDKNELLALQPDFIFNEVSELRRFIFP